MPHPRIARRATATLDAGFDDVDIEVAAMVFTGAAGLPALTGLATATRQTGAITGDEADNWISEQTRRAQEDRLLAAIPMFLATGSR